MKFFSKQPNDHLDYDIVLSDWLADGDEIVSVTWGPIDNPQSGKPTGIDVTGVDTFPDRVKIWITGGESGVEYKFSPLIYTQSRVKEVDFIILVVDI